MARPQDCINVFQTKQEMGSYRDCILPADAGTWAAMCSGLVDSPSGWINHPGEVSNHEILPCLLQPRNMYLGKSYSFFASVLQDKSPSIIAPFVTKGIWHLGPGDALFQPIYEVVLLALVPAAHVATEPSWCHQNSFQHHSGATSSPPKRPAPELRSLVSLYLQKSVPREWNPAFLPVRVSGYGCRPPLCTL